jgi:8-oxo-dGTP pyrophosphatase MutT (NUDIX family)
VTVETSSIKERLRTALASYQRHTIERDLAMPAAAVLVLIFEHEGRPHVVFQRRTDRVQDHKGEISFPGGAMDPGDTDLVMTAVRETHEEIGVRPEDIDVLGPIDDLVTISNYHVTPHVAWLAYYPYQWQFNDEEVAYLIEAPIESLLDPDAFIPDRRMVRGKEFVLPSYQYGPDLVWGATARMLSNFLEIYSAATTNPE